MIQVRCPKCNLLMSMQPIANTAKIDCGRCGRELLVSPDGRVSTVQANKGIAAEVDQYDSTPPPPVVMPPRVPAASVARSSAVTPSTSSSFDSVVEQPQKVATASPTYSRPKRSSNETGLWAILAFLAVLLLGVVGLLGLYLVSGPLASSITGNQSVNAARHTAVAAEATQLWGTTIDSIANIQNLRERDLARKQVLEGTDQFRDLIDRALLISPPTPEQRGELISQVQDVVPTQDPNILNRTIDRARRNGRWVSMDMINEMEMFAFAASDAWFVLAATFAPIPEAKADLQFLERRSIDVQRLVWASLMKVNDSHDYEDLDSVFRRAADQLKQIISTARVQGDGRMLFEDAGMLEPYGFYRMMVRNRMRGMEDQFGSMRQAAALIEYRDLCDRIIREDTGRLEAASDDYQRKYSEVSLPQLRFPGRDPSYQQRQLQRIAGTGLRGRWTPEDSKTEDQRELVESATSRAMEVFAARHRGQETLAIRVTGVDENTRLDLIQEDLRLELRSPAMKRNQIDESNVLWLLVEDAPIDFIVENLFWADVVEIHKSDRLIVVRVRPNAFSVDTGF
ncbi:MAG: hypothetical protein AAF664_09960 [Planctomycetota bacterium]